MIARRVAVAPGSHAVRLAGVSGGGAPRLLAELPARLVDGPKASRGSGLESGLGLESGSGLSWTGRDGRPAGARPDPGRSGVAVQPGSGPERGGERAQVLADLIGPDVDEVVLVYPPGRPSALTRAWLDAAAAVAPRVHRVSAPVAAAAGTGARAVLDIGRTGAEVTLLHRDRIVARRSSGIGGDRLDLAVRAVLAGASADEARRVRETLSLLPEARHGPARIGAEQVRALLTPLLDEAVAALVEVVAVAGEPVVVLLTGGVARSPLLAERVDAAACASEVLVPTRPDLAAVLGAVTLPLPRPIARAIPKRSLDASASPSALPPAPGRPADGEPTSVAPPGAWPCAETAAGAGVSARERRQPPPSAASGSSADPLVPRFLPAPPPSRRARRWGSAAATALLVGGLAGVGTAVAVPLRAPPTAGSSDIGSAVLVQYGYRLDLPPGWAHTGGLPERRRSLLTRVAAPDGTDLIAVERTPLGYDADAEPERAAAELRTVFDRAVATGSELSGYGSTRIGGRVVTTYLQRERAGAVVEWFVVLDGDAQLSVGCRHTPAATEAVRAACGVVVASIRRA